MAAGRDYYDVLGVSRTATTDEIQDAWRGLVRQYHPDVSDAPDAEARFNEIQEAYDVLSDDTKRSELTGSVEPGGGSRGWPGGGGGGASVDASQFQDIFEEMFSGGGGGFGQGGFRPGAEPRAQRGSDLRMTLSITFRTAAARRHRAGQAEGRYLHRGQDPRGHRGWWHPSSQGAGWSGHAGWHRR